MVCAGPEFRPQLVICKVISLGVRRSQMGLIPACISIFATKYDFFLFVRIAYLIESQ